MSTGKSTLFSAARAQGGSVQFQTLALELGGGVLHIKAGPGIVSIIEKPVNGVDVDANVNGVRFEPLGLR